MESALIAQYLGPHARRMSHYRVHTSAPAARTYEAALRVSLRDVPVVRLLFGLRGIPYRADMTVREFFSTGSFRILGEDPPREIVFAIERAEMRAVGNFRVMTTPSGSVLSTDTWVETDTSRADRAFRLYWAVIAPFSGLIRRALLHAARRRAER
ncbi:MAG: hypothetical protein AUH31_05145 [Armatimonadetes bacterium 13_1_40CM_64_14]|nr:MAG: hypothetical protein AUH31_05145 [Armatimonadetes bacterium 13_1_40CM_64_14]